MTVHEFYNWCCDRGIENCPINIVSEVNLGFKMQCYMDLTEDDINVVNDGDKKGKIVVIESGGNACIT